jgi:hypothetical protein
VRLPRAFADTQPTRRDTKAVAAPRAMPISLLKSLEVHFRTRGNQLAGTKTSLFKKELAVRGANYIPGSNLGHQRHFRSIRFTYSRFSLSSELSPGPARLSQPSLRSYLVAIDAQFQQSRAPRLHGAFERACEIGRRLHPLRIRSESRTEGHEIRIF